MNFDEVNERIYKLLNGLRKYPKMYFQGEPTYMAYETYLLGFLTGLTWLHNSSIDITAWFTQQRGENNYAVGFSGQIKHIYEDKTEKERIEILLETVENFFRENPDWYLPKQGAENEPVYPM